MGNVSKRPWRRWFGIAALAAASGTSGWALGQHGHDERGPAPEHTVGMRGATVRESPPTRGSGAAVQAFADGTVSVHVDRVAAEWLLRELGRRGAVQDAAGSIKTEDGVVIDEASCELAVQDTDVVHVELLERTLTEGSERERYDALTQALEAGIDLPPELLGRLYESDPSESVRLLAFTTYVDSVSDDRSQVRAALQSGVYDSSTAVQAEAQRRLAELERYELALSETRPQGLP